MAPPTFVSVTETAWNTSTTPKDTASIAVQNGDLIVAIGIVETNYATTISTQSGSTSAWATTAINQPDYTFAIVGRATATATGNIVVRFTAPTRHGGAVWVFRNSDGFGTVVSNYGNNVSCSVSIDPASSASDSAIVMGVGDWDAEAVATVLTNAGTFTETERSQISGFYSIYAGYHANAGTSSAVNIGVNSSALKWSLVAVEVKGQAGGGGGVPKHMSNYLRQMGA